MERLSLGHIRAKSTACPAEAEPPPAAGAEMGMSPAISPAFVPSIAIPGSGGNSTNH
jgi:hypothetical protein